MKNGTKTCLVILLSVLSGWSNMASAQWVQANTGLTINEVNSFASIGTTLFATTGNISGNGQGVFKSTDNGGNWTACNSGFLSLDTRQILAVGDTLFVAVAGTNLTDGGIYRSTDQGATWVQFNNGLNRNIAYSIVYMQGVLYTAISAPMSSKAVYTSTDFGNTWTPTGDLVLNDNTIKSMVSIGGNIIAGSDGGVRGVFYSADAGVTWNTTSITDETDALAVIGTTVFAATAKGVKKSADNGLTWTTTANASGVIDNATALAAISNCLFVGTPGGSVYSSSDEGATWKNESTGAAGALSPEALAVHGGFLFAAINFKSVGIWKRPTGEFSCGGTSEVKAPSEVNPSIRVYPNPSTGVFTLVSGSPLSEVKVYNLLGELIFMEEKAGSTLTIDLSGTPAGVYFYQVRDGNGMSSGKVLIE